MVQHRWVRRGSCAVVTGVVALAALTPTASAATSPGGSAQAAAVTVTLSPQALAAIAVPGPVQSAIASLPPTCGLQHLLSGLAASVNATTSVALDSAATRGTLNPAASDLVAGTAASSIVATNLAGVDDVVAHLSGLLRGEVSCLVPPAVVAQLPGQAQQELATLEQQVSTLGAPVSSLLSTGPTLGTNVSLDQAPVQQSAVTLASQYQLAPFASRALSAAGARHYGDTTGPQLESDNAITTANVGQNIALSTASAQATAGTLLSTAGSELTAVGTALTALQSQAATTVCSTLPSSLPACSTLQGLSPGQATQALQGALQAAQGALQTVVAQLQPLQPVLAALGGVTLDGLVHADGLTASATTVPKNGGVDSVATSTIGDLRVLSANLLGAIPGVTAPLLELTATHAEAHGFVNGSSHTLTDAPATIGRLSVLGQTIALPAGQTPTSVTVPTPAGDVTVSVSAGAPNIVNDTDQRVTEALSALHIAITNGDSNRANGIAALGGSGGDLATVDVDQVQVDNAMTAPGGLQAANITTPSTGLFGPTGLAGVAVLLALGLGLRLTGRRRGASA